jgi:hypothetical protein
LVSRVLICESRLATLADSADSPVRVLFRAAGVLAVAADSVFSEPVSWERLIF